MKTIETKETNDRVYIIKQETESGLFCCYYQPRNPKNGKPWQAARDVGHKNHDGHVLHNWNTKETTGVIASHLEKIDWTKWTGATTGFLSIETAREAIEKEITKKSK